MAKIPQTSAEARLAAPPRGELGRRAAAVAETVTGLRDLVHQAQVREALTRTELTLALSEAMKARATAENAVRADAARRYLEQAVAGPPRRRGKLVRGREKLLLRLGRVGQAKVIADAGVWRGRAAEIGDYVRQGASPLAQPDALFDQAWYLEAYPQVAASGLAPLAHYLIHGGPAGFSPHPLFHRNYYHESNAAELAATQMSALEHFVRRGAALGRNPHPAFDILYYAAQGPELAAGEDPLSHYLRQGWRDDLSPHPLFDPAWFRREAPRRASEVPPLVYYLTTGWLDGLSPHPLFDPKWYLEQNPEVAEIGFEPLTHFLIGGAAEGRAAGPWFDTAHYMAARGEALPPAANPLVDYLQGGAWTVAEARPGFPTAAYLAQNPALVAEGATPLEHWVRKAAGA